MFTSNINVVVQVHRNLHKTISMSNDNNNKRVMINNNGMHNEKVITLNNEYTKNDAVLQPRLGCLVPRPRTRRRALDKVMGGVH